MPLAEQLLLGLLSTNIMLAVLGASDKGISGVVLSTVFVLSVFGCVLLHELGHALMARSFGIETRDITLLPIGGVARLERMSDKPGEEIAIAVAGPLVNVVIATGLWMGLWLAGVSVVASAANMLRMPLAEQLLLGLLSTNIMLVLFNLIPAFPMDGGRVLRALLSFPFGRLRGTEIAVGLSKVLAMVFIAAGLLAMVPGFGSHLSPFLALIGLFVIVAGNQELAMLHYQSRRSVRATFGQPPMSPAAGSIYPAPPVQPHFSGFIWDPRAGAWIEWRDGHAVGATYVNPSGQPW
jgi:Zn-dependent protease